MFECKVVVKAEDFVEGEVLYLPRKISLLEDISPEGELKGKPVSGKIIVCLGEKGSTVGAYRLYALSRKGKKPKAFLVKELPVGSNVLVVACSLARVSLVVVPDPSFWDNIGAFEKLKIDLERGEVIPSK